MFWLYFMDAKKKVQAYFNIRDSVCVGLVWAGVFCIQDLRLHWIIDLFW